MPRIDSYLRPESYVGDLGVDENLMSDEFWHTLREAFCGWERKEVGSRKNPMISMDFYFGAIFSVPWQARIVEVREEIDRVLSQTADNLHKADSILRLLQDKQLDRIG